MMRSRRLGMSFPLLLASLYFITPLHADVIYLIDGNIMMVDKAWEEGNEIKYQTGRGIRSLPKTDVKEIRRESPSTEPTAQKWSLGVESGSRRVQTPGNGASASSEEALGRLRENLKADPSDARAKM